MKKKYVRSIFLFSLLTAVVGNNVKASEEKIRKAAIENFFSSFREFGLSWQIPDRPIEKKPKNSNRLFQSKQKKRQERILFLKKNIVWLVTDYLSNEEEIKKNIYSLTKKVRNRAEIEEVFYSLIKERKERQAVVNSIKNDLTNLYKYASYEAIEISIANLSRRYPEDVVVDALNLALKEKNETNNKDLQEQYN